MIQARRQVSIGVVGMSTFLASIMPQCPVLSAITAPLPGLAVPSCHLGGVRVQSIALAQEPS